jgi:flagellar hook-associated protein 1 FlgK
MWGGLSNALNTATTSLGTNASLQAIVARNVSNAQNSSGYVSAKVANLVTGSGGAAIVRSIRNLTSAPLFNAMLAGTSGNAMAQALADGVAALQTTVADSTSTTDSTTAAQSPSTLIQALTSALQTYSSSPSNTSAASAVFVAATNLANGLNDATDTTQEVRRNADAAMVASVANINAMLTQFQEVNAQIVHGTATGVDVTDALDQRDTILQSLSQEVGISTVSNSDGSLSIYTDSGVTLFETTPRAVTMAPTTAYSPTTEGAAVYIDGVPVTGSQAIMPILSGALTGNAKLRDEVAVTYQSQLDAVAGGMINAFKESYTDPVGGTTGPDLPGLFTYAGATAVPGSTLVPGLAGLIKVSAAVDPAQGGSYSLIRDGGINDTPPNTYYTQNKSHYEGYNTGLLADISALNAKPPLSPAFPGGTDLSTDSSLTGFAADSASWLNSKYQATNNSANYQATLLSQTSQALSNATGVNIDQQMSKMLEYENAYQASAKLISTMNTMIDSLLQAVS